MAEVLLNDLAPNSTYVVQVRAVAGGQAGEWSPAFTFLTDGDSIPPSPPTSLQWIVNGTSFQATWEAPTTDSDGQPLKDLNGYIVTVIAGGGNNKYVVPSESFDFTLEMNRGSFGFPHATVDVTVVAKDVFGNLSSPIAASATNPPPAAIDAVFTESMPSAVNVKWNSVPDPDVLKYEVYMDSVSGFTPNASNRVFSGVSTSTVVKVPDTSDRFFRVAVYDVFLSSTMSAEVTGRAGGAAGTPDSTPPGVPTGVVASGAVDTLDPTRSTAVVSVSWTAPADTDLFGYKIRYRKAGATDWAYMDVGKVTGATISPLRSGTQYDIEIAAYDVYSNQSAFVAVTPSLTTPQDTTAPAQVTGVLATTGVKSITVSWTGSTETDVWRGNGFYTVQKSTTSDFSSDVQTNHISATVTTFSNVVSGTIYYFRVAAVDSSGNTGPYSSTVSVQAGKVTNSEISAGTISGDKIVAGSITGTEIQAGSVNADRLQANTAIISNLDIESKLTIDSVNGSIQSNNYSQVGKTGFRLTQNSLDIFDGSIEAKALKIQSNTNLLPPQYASFLANGAFYNTVGNVATSASTLVVGWDNGFFASAPEPALTLQNTTATPATAYLARRLSAAGVTPVVAEFNIPMPQAGFYIASAYILHNEAAPITVGINAADSGGVTTNSVSIPVFTWTRISVRRNMAGGATGRVELVVPANCKIWVKFPQFEFQMGAETSPGRWSPSGVTNIDGASITTGQIRSSNYSAGSAGWLIDLQGNVEFASGTFRGNVTGAAITGGTIEIPSGTLGIGSVLSKYKMNADELNFSLAGTYNEVINPSFENTFTSIMGTAGVVIDRNSRGPLQSNIVGKTDRITAYGRRCLKVYNNDGTGSGGYVVIHGGMLSPNQTYTFSFYVAGADDIDNPPVTPSSIKVKFWDVGIFESSGSGTTLLTRWAQGVDTKMNVSGKFYGVYPESYSDQTARSIVSETGWTRRWSKTFTTPNWGSGSREFSIVLPVPVTTQTAQGEMETLYYDGLQVESNPRATRYIDGDQPGCEWPGFDRLTGTGAIPHQVRSHRSEEPTFWLPTYGDPIINSSLKVGDTTVSKIKVGTGSLHGQNTINAYMDSTTSVPNATWVDIGWTQYDLWNFARDDGALYANPYFLTPVDGVWSLSASIAWDSGTTGIRAIRLITDGGYVLAWNNTSASVFRGNSVAWTGYIAAGTKVKVQGYQTNGAALFAISNTSFASLPTRAWWALMV